MFRLKYWTHSNKSLLHTFHSFYSENNSKNILPILISIYILLNIIINKIWPNILKNIFKIRIYICMYYLIGDFIYLCRKFVIIVAIYLKTISKNKKNYTYC